MSSVREAIREQNRLARMRQGQDVPERLAIPSMPEVSIAIVPLSEAESQVGIVAAASLEVPDNQAGIMARERAATVSDVFHAVREPGHPTIRVWDTPEEMVEELTPADVDFLADNLVTLQEYASPALDGLSDKELDDLKKAFGETDWSALTGRRWAAMKLCCTILFPELLAVRLRGSSSTDSLIETSASAEST
jgi:hypothetical protein